MCTLPSRLDGRVLLRLQTLQEKNLRDQADLSCNRFPDARDAMIVFSRLHWHAGCNAHSAG